jgi:SAM-dependent methyltransferase
LGREFDVVVSSEVAEHVELEWRHTFFANLAALARPGGLLVLTTPDRGALESRGRPLEDDQPVNHLFTRSELVGWLDGEFEVLSHGGVHPVVRRRWLDLAWKVLFLPVGYRGVHRLARALSIPGAYQVVAMRRRAPA